MSFNLASLQAMSAVGSLLVLQLVVILFLVGDVTGNEITAFLGSESIIVVVFLAVILVIGLNVYFGGESGYKKVIEQFDSKKETQLRRILNGFLIWLYILTLIGLVYYLA